MDTANDLIPPPWKVASNQLACQSGARERGTYGSFQHGRLNRKTRVGVKTVLCGGTEDLKLSSHYSKRFPCATMAACFRAAKELQILKLLCSNHVVQCFGGFFLLEDGVLVCKIIMERYPYTLHDYLTKTAYGIYDLERRVQLVGRLCGLLLFLIRQQVSHSDIKANNILMTQEGVPVLADFGVACAMGDNVGKDILMDGDFPVRTKVTSLPYYVHPAARTSRATAIVDMHAFTCLFVELLFGSASRIFKELAKHRVFRTEEAARSDVAERLPVFIDCADKVLNNGEQFAFETLKDACGK